MKNKLLVLFILILSSSLAVTASLWGWADLNANKAYSYLDKWQETNQIGSINEWQAAFHSIRQARKYNPYSVDYMITMGQLYEWSATLMVFRSDKQKSLNEAKNYYRLATEHRPTWPHAWAHYAYIKALLGESDESLSLAVSKTEEYGPWIKEAQKKMIIVSLHEWNNLPLSVQSNMKKAMQKWLVNNKFNMGQFIIGKAVDMEKSYVVRDILDNMDSENENTILLEDLKAKKSAYCKENECVLYPIRRFDERFEV